MSQQDSTAVEAARLTARCELECKAELDALLVHHHDIYDALKRQRERAELSRQLGLDSGIGCATSSRMRAVSVEIRSSGNGEIV